MQVFLQLSVLFYVVKHVSVFSQAPVFTLFDRYFISRSQGLMGRMQTLIPKQYLQWMQYKRCFYENSWNGGTLACEGDPGSAVLFPECQRAVPRALPLWVTASFLLWSPWEQQRVFPSSAPHQTALPWVSFQRYGEPNYSRANCLRCSVQEL